MRISPRQPTPWVKVLSLTAHSTPVPAHRVPSPRSARNAPRREDNPMHSLLTLLLQIGVILVVSRGVGMLFRKIHQPQVVGEMAAGILLGPSLLGWALPEVSAFLFPAASLVHLGTLS